MEATQVVEMEESQVVWLTKEEFAHFLDLPCIDARLAYISRVIGDTDQVLNATVRQFPCGNLLMKRVVEEARA